MNCKKKRSISQEVLVLGYETELSALTCLYVCLFVRFFFQKNNYYNSLNQIGKLLGPQNTCVQVTAVSTSRIFFELWLAEVIRRSEGTTCIQHPTSSYY